MAPSYVLIADKAFDDFMRNKDKFGLNKQEGCKTRLGKSVLMWPYKKSQKDLFLKVFDILDSIDLSRKPEDEINAILDLINGKVGRDELYGITLNAINVELKSRGMDSNRDNLLNILDDVSEKFYSCLDSTRKVKNFNNEKNKSYRKRVS